MKTHPSLNLIAALFGSVALLSACGGGGGDSAAPAPVPPPATPGHVNVSTSVIDGAIQNATVCLDKNDNGACDADEASGKTAADGSVTLSVPEADAGNYPLIAVVGTDAIDKDHGAVTQSFTLTTTADKPAVLSPLTTLVRAQVDASGLSTADADKLLQNQLGLEASLFTDFSTGSDAQATTLSRLARLVALIKGKAFDGVKESVGGDDGSGGTVSRGDLERAIDQKIMQEAQATLALLSTDGVRNAATPAERDTALQAAADTLIAQNADFDAVTAAAAMKQAQTGVPVPDSSTYTGGASLRWFTYADSGNWYFRDYESTVAQDTPDAAGLRHFTEKRKQAVNGVVQVWGESPNFTRTDLYWTGTEWFACPTDFQQSGTHFDSNGVSESNYCNGYRNHSRRTGRDIAGENIADVVREIRAYPLIDTEGSFAAWGPNPDDPRLAGLKFPAGSKLLFHSAVDLASPDGYRPQDIVASFVPSITNGVPSECSKVNRANAATFTFNPKTLDELVAANPGKPCVYQPRDGGGPRNEWWSNSTLSIGTVPGPAPAYPAYMSNRSIRAAFDSAGQKATYYNCVLPADGGGASNCEQVGSGTYSIDTLGDARVLRLSGVPSDAAPVTYSREFVERGGAVYYGFRSKLRQSYQVRPNQEAIDALFAPLGIVR